MAKQGELLLMLLLLLLLAWRTTAAVPKGKRCLSPASLLDSAGATALWGCISESALHDPAGGRKKVPEPLMSTATAELTTGTAATRARGLPAMVMAPPGELSGAPFCSL